MLFYSKLRGNTYTSKKLLSQGGEGKIFTIKESNSIVAKIYLKPSIEKESKLVAMIENPPLVNNKVQKYDLFAWPQDILVDKNGRFIGFIMNKIRQSSGFNRIINPILRKQYFPNLTFKDLLVICHNISVAFDILHRKGYVVGDINESNILLSREGYVSFVDTDSFQVRSQKTNKVFYCPVLRPEYTPPELHGKNVSKLTRFVRHDLFGLGVLLFQLLMEGNHPFNGKPTRSEENNWTDLGKRIKNGNFPFGNKQYPISKKPIAPDLLELYPELSRLFKLCFENGRATPSLRPDTKDWLNAIKLASQNLEKCNNNSQHHFSSHLNKCPFCEREQIIENLKDKAKKSIPNRVKSFGLNLLKKKTPEKTTPASIPNKKFSPPPPPLPPPPPEIQPGIWTFKQQVIGVNNSQIFQLGSDGSVTAFLSLNMMMGMGMKMSLNGIWVYNIMNKTLVINGQLTMNNYSSGNATDDFLLSLAGGLNMPPVPYSASFRIKSKIRQNSYVVINEANHEGILEKG